MGLEMTKRMYAPEGTLLNKEENLYYTSNLRRLDTAMKNGIILEGIATRCDCTDMSLYVSVGQFCGIIRREESMTGDIKDIAVITRVGKAVSFKILSIDVGEGGEVVLYLSRRLAQEECTEEFISRLVPGDILPATVTHMENFGAFLDIGCGIVSLVTVDSVSISRIAHPRERFRSGENIMCVVKSVDRDNSRIYMSCRELLGTWEENVANFAQGQTVTGVIRSIEEYGVFVELAPNLAGLAEYRDGFNVGDVCAVYIKSIIPEKMKIKLVLIDTSSERFEMRLKFYPISECGHINSWRYSPSGSSKVVESIFTE